MKQMGTLKLITVWSLIPTYCLAGGFLGYAIDRWLHTFPLITGAGIIVAFGFAIRDMLRLRDEVFGKKT
jgi:hypothetical protein